MRDIPRAGEFYRHFKGNLYQIVAVCKDADTMDNRVVYQALYDTFQIYDRLMVDFMSKVDREKYPDVTQKYRFEQVELVKEEGERSIIPVKTTITQIYDDADIPVISMEDYPGIENQRKEIETEKRMHLEDHVKGALENHVGQADPNDIHYVDEAGNGFHTRPLTEEEVVAGIDPKLIAFLDADSYTQKLEIFNHMRENITEKILNDITAVLDISPIDGSLEEQYMSVKKDLETMAKFERNKN